MKSIVSLLKKARLGLVGLAFGALAAGAVSASTVTVIADVNAQSSRGANATVYANILGSNKNVLFSRSQEQQAATKDFFNTFAGVTATESNADLSGGILGTVDLLVITRFFNNALDYTAAELTAIGNFVTGGGNVLMVTEASAGNTAVLDTYDAVLAAMGSTIRYTGGRNVVPFTDASLEDTVISTNADSFSVDAYAFLSGGQAVAMDDAGNVFVAVEGLNAVPIPAGLPLMMGVIAAFGVVRRRRT